MLTIVAAHDTGPFQTLVRLIGFLFSTVLAIGVAWRGRSDTWEPTEADLSGAPAKVAGLLCVVALGVMWATMVNPQHTHTLAVLAIGLGIACVIGLIVYGTLIGTLVHVKEESLENEKTTYRKIVGGLWLRRAARQKRKASSLTIKRMFEKAAFYEDDLWSPLSLTVAKSVLAIAYIAFSVCGTLAVASVGMFLLAEHVG